MAIDLREGMPYVLFSEDAKRKQVTKKNIGRRDYNKPLKENRISTKKYFEKETSFAEKFEICDSFGLGKITRSSK